jgi:hypothetical protein
MAFEEATRAINGQHDSLEALRNRAVTLVSAGAVVFSLFTSQALGKHHVDGWIWGALGSFGLLAIACAVVLKPRHFRFRTDVTELLVEIDGLKGGVTPVSRLRSAQRDWAQWLTLNYNENQKTIDCLVDVYEVGLGALTLELLLLSLALLLG